MSSSFTGPIRIYKYNNSTNNGVIAPDNTGAARVSQQQFFAPITAVQSAGAIPTFDIGTTTAVPFVIPAGSIITNVTGYFTTAAGTPAATNVTVAGTTVGTLSDAAGINNITFGTGSTAVGLLANVGTADVTVSYTAGASAVGTLSVRYTPRNSNGSITAYGSGLSNS